MAELAQRLRTRFQARVNEPRNAPQGDHVSTISVDAIQVGHDPGRFFVGANAVVIRVGASASGEVLDVEG